MSNGWRRKHGLPPLPISAEDAEVVPPLPSKPERVQQVEPPDAAQAWEVWDVVRVLSNGDRAVADRAFQAARKRKKEHTP